MPPKGFALGFVTSYAEQLSGIRSFRGHDFREASRHAPDLGYLVFSSKPFSLSFTKFAFFCDSSNVVGCLVVDKYREVACLLPFPVYIPDTTTFTPITRKTKQCASNKGGRFKQGIRRWSDPHHLSEKNTSCRRRHPTICK